MGVLGQRIRELRKKGGLTQELLAEGIIARSYLSQIEKGSVQPSYEVLEKLSAKLGCTVDSFFENLENKLLPITEKKKTIKKLENLVEINHIEQAKKILEDISFNEFKKELNSYELGALSWVKGKIEVEQKRWKVAEVLFIKSISLFEEGKYVEKVIRSTDSLVQIYFQTDQVKEAFHILNKHYNTLLYFQINGLSKISFLINLGIAHARLGEYHSAIRFLKEADELNNSSNILYKTGHIYMTLGICYRRLNQWDDAQTCYKNALKFFDMVNDLENKAGTLTNLGVLYKYKQEINKSIKTLNRAVDLYSELHDETGLCNALIELASSHLINHEWDQTERYCRDIIEKVTNHKLVGNAYYLLAELKMKEQKYTYALENCIQAKRFYKEFNHRDGILDSLKLLSKIFFALEDFENSAINCMEVYNLE
jgi:transcriptional regulator with XRE-family HTH domain